ncbi:MAG: transposase [Syntrophorhabdaceae bacterium]|nr:transposase [Syntrophorhabdaceae bacterium]MDD4195257.1 transposase [Syntrophorhabdaceae bacterium]
METRGVPLREADENIKKLAQMNADASLLLSVPGMGNYSALLIASEIGDISRFPSAKKLCSYAGLVPCVYSSGGKDPVRQYHQARIKMAAMDTDRTVASLYTKFTKNEGLLCRDRLQAREEQGARSCDAGDAEDHLRHADEKKGMHKGIDRPSLWGHGLPCLKRQSP